jgi:hypothetical protein
MKISKPIATGRSLPQIVAFCRRESVQHKAYPLHGRHFVRFQEAAEVWWRYDGGDKAGKPHGIGEGIGGVA